MDEPGSNGPSTLTGLLKETYPKPDKKKKFKKISTMLGK